MVPPHLRNSFESEAMLETIVQVINAVLTGRPLHFVHSSRWRHHLHLVTIIISVIDVESWSYGLAEQFGIALPNKMPSPNNPLKLTQASLEYRARFLLRIAKGNLKYFRLTRQERGDVLRRVNNSFRSLGRAIRLRNQVAHGKTFYSVSKTGKIRRNMSKTISEIDGRQTRTLYRACYIFKEFCELMINPNYRSSGAHGKAAGRGFLGQLVGVPISMYRRRS